MCITLLRFWRQLISLLGSFKSALQVITWRSWTSTSNGATMATVFCSANRVQLAQLRQIHPLLKNSAPESADEWTWFLLEMPRHTYDTFLPCSASSYTTSITGTMGFCRAVPTAQRGNISYVYVTCFVCHDSYHSYDSWHHLNHFAVACFILALDSDGFGLRC